MVPHSAKVLSNQTDYVLLPRVQIFTNGWTDKLFLHMDIGETFCAATYSVPVYYGRTRCSLIFQMRRIWLYGELGRSVMQALWVSRLRIQIEMSLYRGAATFRRRRSKSYGATARITILRGQFKRAGWIVAEINVQIKSVRTKKSSCNFLNSITNEIKHFINSV